MVGRMQMGGRPTLGPGDGLVDGPRPGPAHISTDLNICWACAAGGRHPPTPDDNYPPVGQVELSAGVELVDLGEGLVEDLEAFAGLRFGHHAGAPHEVGWGW